MVSQLSSEMDAKDILVLTPFRAQRRLIKSFIKKSGIRGVTVSTVHRAQGSERHTIIFDPVAGSNKFLKTEDAPRLINVALSRAKARLVLLLSNQDLENPTFQKLNLVIQNLGQILQSDGIRPSKSQRNRHVSLILADAFPVNAINKEISIKSSRGEIVGRVTGVSEDGREFSLFIFATGETKKFKTEFVKRNATSFGVG